MPRSSLEHKSSFHVSQDRLVWSGVVEQLSVRESWSDLVIIFGDYTWVVWAERHCR